MLNLKKSSFSLAVATLAATTGALFSTTAQAAIIGGQISGIWQHDGDGEGGFNVGDLFTADYTYDSDSISTYDYSSYYYDISLLRSVSLLSLVVNSGAISQIFDFNDGSYSILQWFDVQGNPDTLGQYVETGYALNASTPKNHFSASTVSGQSTNGSPFSSSSALAYSYDPNTYTFQAYAKTSRNVTFSEQFLADPSEPTVSTPEPTSALLTGLIGLGVMVLHRRKKIEVAAE